MVYNRGDKFKHKSKKIQTVSLIKLIKKDNTKQNIQAFLLIAIQGCWMCRCLQGRAKPMEKMDGSQQQAVSPVAVKWSGLTSVDGNVSPSGTQGLMSRISILRLVIVVWFRCAWLFQCRRTGRLLRFRLMAAKLYIAGIRNSIGRYTPMRNSG
jgi:hypothetical protein